MAAERRGTVVSIGIIAAAVATVIAAGVNSCATVNRPLIAPPQIAGAEFIGSEECADCHEDQTRDFDTATHAMLQAGGENAVNVGCESCHGAASLHVESGGERGTIVNPKSSPAPCFECHQTTRGDFALPHTHPVTGGPLQLTKGQVSCNDCHELHKGDAAARGATSTLGRNEPCVSCHIAQRGPFVFEHEAMREGCTVCHNAHGSVNAKLLTERDANLCLKCHASQSLPGTLLVGGRDHSFFLTQGTCASGGCHEAVHGSQVNSSLRF